MLVEPNQAGLFVNAIKTLQSNPERAIKMALNARAKVEQFDWEIVKKQWFSVLE
jgi:glycosyltransferase involved in cell wall biosynthesis